VSSLWEGEALWDWKLNQRRREMFLKMERFQQYDDTIPKPSLAHFISNAKLRNLAIGVEVTLNPLLQIFP
jgi:hypothetical protein